MPWLSPLPWKDLEGAQHCNCFTHGLKSDYLFQSGPQQQGRVPAGAGVDQKAPAAPSSLPLWNVNQAPASAANSLPFGKLKK